MSEQKLTEIDPRWHCKHCYCVRV